MNYFLYRKSNGMGLHVCFILNAMCGNDLSSNLLLQFAQQTLEKQISQTNGQQIESCHFTKCMQHQPICEN